MGTNLVSGACLGCISSALLLALPARAASGAPSPALTTAQATVAHGSSSSPRRNIARAADEPPAPAPTPPAPTTEIAEQAGVGGGQAYATAGVLELGGFANFTGASNFTSLQLSPTAGFFLFDSFELSLIFGLNYVHQTLNPGTSNEVSDHKTIFRLLAEPSYHLPLSRSIWAFVGVGLGIASVPRSGGGTSTGFDLAPRLGANFLVGRSGLFTPALFIDWTTGDSIPTNTGGTLLGVSTTYGIQLGYTVMW